MPSDFAPGSHHPRPRARARAQAGALRHSRRNVRPPRLCDVTDQLVVGGELGNYLIGSVIGRTDERRVRGEAYAAGNACRPQGARVRVFFCGVGEVTAVLPDSRRQAGASSEA